MENRTTARLRALVAATTLLGALLIIYGPLVWRDPILTRDDRTLLKPLESVHNVSDYAEQWSQHRILDLQPLRDASFLLDLTLRSRLGVGLFHTTNLLLWIVIVVLAWRIFLCDRVAPWLAAGGVALFAVHPVFVGAVGWISARKHLLACAFILGATLVFEGARSRRKLRGWEAVAIVALYLASTLSQPIAVLWPLWVALVLLLGKVPRRSPFWLLTGACLLIMAGVLAANYAYYTGAYERLTTTSKFVDTRGTFGVGLLAFGRYVGNFFWPTHLATQYAPGSWLELFGLGLAVALGLLLRGFSCGPAGVKWAAFFAFPLLLVTVRMTNVYASDTYALTSGVGLLGLLLVVVSRVVQRWPRSKPAFGIVAAILFVMLTAASRAQAGSWLSDAALWAQADRVEPTPTTAARHAHYLLQEGRRDEAMSLLQTIPEDERRGEVAMVLDKALYDAPTLSAEEKTLRLEAEPVSPWRNYYLAALDAAAGQFTDANRLMHDAFAMNPRFGEDLPIIAAESEFFCRRAGASDCDAFVAGLRRRFGGWDEEKYQSRRSRLGLR